VAGEAVLIRPIAQLGVEIRLKSWLEYFQLIRCSRLKSRLGYKGVRSCFTLGGLKDQTTNLVELRKNILDPITHAHTFGNIN
jgi:hypothetical protein